MKDAKSEAQKEIEDYRSQKETEFKKFETEVSHDNACTAHLYSQEHSLYKKASHHGHQLTANSTPAETRRPRRMHRRLPTSSSRRLSRSARRPALRYELPSSHIWEIANAKQVVEDLLKAVTTVNPEVPTRTEQPTV